MHFIIHNKENLAKKVALNIKAIEKNTIISSLSNIKLEVLDSTLILTSFDGNNCVISNIEITNISDINKAIMVDSQSFKSIVDRLINVRSEEIEFQLLEETSELSIKANRTRLKIKVILDTTDFSTVPSLEEFKDYKTVSFDKKKLIDSVSKIAKCSIKNNTQPVLEAVNLIVEDNMCDVVALDGYRLGINVIECDSSENFKISASANRLKDVLKDVSLSNAEYVELKSNGKYVLIQSGDVNIFIREIEGDMTAYKRLLTKNFSYECVVDKEEFLYILNSSMIATNKNNKIVNLSIKPAESKVEINSKGDKISDFFDEIEVEFFASEKEDLNISFNLTYLCELIGNVNTKNARLYFKNSISPVYIENEDDEKDRYLILPVRVNR